MYFSSPNSGKLLYSTGRLVEKTCVCYFGIDHPTGEGVTAARCNPFANAGLCEINQPPWDPLWS